MKTLIQIIGRLTVACVLALGLDLYFQAQAQESPPGTYFSAKDPDLAPLPFNPYPELPVTEISPGIFVVDDTGIPDSPQQVVSRKLRKAAAEKAKAIAADPVLSAAAQAAQQAAQAASFATTIEEISPWLHDPIQLPDGTPTDFQTAIDDSITNLVVMTATNDWRQAALDRALAWAATNDLPAEIASGGDMDTKARLISIDEGPLYLSSFNLEAAQTIATDKVWPGGSTGLNLNGTNRTLFMWDEGQPRLTHREHTNRVVALPLNTASNQHSTAVAGTLVAGGVSNSAKGMSFAGRLNAGNNLNDFSQMPNQINTNGMRLSNHSYGQKSGWYLETDGWYWYGNSEISTNQDPKYGNYTVYAAQLDLYGQNALSYLGVWAAGNEVSNAPPSQPLTHFEFNLQNTRYSTNTVHPPYGDAAGYDTISDIASAKNILTVGAVNPLTNGYTASSNVVWAFFSSCGPTDDGRIKPDVVGAGVNLVTCNYSNDASYGVFSGTSFSAPSVAGSVNLLAQHYQQLHPNSYEPLSSTLKGLVIHTADKATTNAGPSYRTGWGLMNTAKAAALLSNDATNGLKNFVKEVLLFNGTSAEFPVISAGTNPLVVTICWADPYSPSYHAITNSDNTQTMLVNDLDLRVISPNGTTNLPWVLNPDLTNQTADARAAAATAGDDTRNNVEQVYLANPTNGTYLVRVTHKGTLQSGNPQWASMLVSGTVPQAAPPLIINQIVQVSTNVLAIGWPSVVGQIYQVQYVNTVSSSNFWQNLGGQFSARLTNVVVGIQFDPASVSQFYRVVQVP